MSADGGIFDRYPALRGKPAAMAMFCTLLRDRGLHADALAIGEAAVAAAPNDLAVRGEVNATLARGVDAFHGAMMLDAARNAAYSRAIEAAVRPGIIVLEIGAGAGLLALIAARAGARVFTCESNPMVAAAAQAIVARNGYADRITVLAKRSDALQVPEDLPEPADLVIHEIFGSQLFDEGVTGALTDARRRLLKPGAVSVPSGAAVRCALVAAPKPPETTALTDVCGFDLSGFELLVRPRNVIFATRRGGLELRSAPGSALAMDYDAAPPFGPVSETIQLESAGGRVDGIVQWIEIRFPDGTRHESDPFEDRPDSSWAAWYQSCRMPFETAPGERIDVTLKHRDLMLTINVARQPES